MKPIPTLVLTALFAAVLTACNRAGDRNPPTPLTPTPPTTSSSAAHPAENLVTLSPEQIASAGIQLIHASRGGGTRELPALIESNPDATQVVSAAIGGRIVRLARNLGQSVSRGQTLAVIESREAAQLKGEVEASRARLALAESNLGREQRLFAERVSPEQDLITARTAAIEARIAYRQAQQQVSAAGGGGDGLNRLNISAPMAGQVIARPVVLGQTVAADAELFRIADLDQVSLSLSLQPADASRVTVGAPIRVSAAGRESQATVKFISPALDPATRLVPAIALLDNQGGRWRVGEPVTASVPLGSEVPDGALTLRVPAVAVQTINGKPVVFVRTPQGFRGTPVVLGAASGDSVTVLGGLTGQEALAGQGSFVLKAELGKADAAED